MKNEAENIENKQGNGVLPCVSYRLLLEKYIRYVMEVEGSDFIRYGKDWGADVEFTDQEWNLLTKIATKVNGS